MVTSVFIFVLILFHWIDSIQCQNDRTKIQNQQIIYLHIGPHKTGTSHFQAFVHENRERLKEENLCWPNELHLKAFSIWAMSIATDGISEPFAQYARSCVEQNMNLLISGERMSFFSHNEILKLQAFCDNFSEGHNVVFKIILSYREWLREAISRYGEIAKNSGKVRNTNNFIEYVFFSGTTFRTLYSDMIKSWSSVFGSENIIIIDYYGLEAEKIDISNVILCEIANVFCGRLDTLKSANVQNEHLDPIYENFIFVLDDYLNANRMKQCSLSYTYQLSYMDYLSQKQIKFPVLSSNFDLFLSERFRLNDEMYGEYGHLMLHANKTYNEMKIVSHIFEELDVNRLFQDPEWEGFMLSEKNRLIEEGKICDLTTGEVIRFDRGHHNQQHRDIAHH